MVYVIINGVLELRDYDNILMVLRWDFGAPKVKR